MAALLDFGDIRDAQFARSVVGPISEVPIVQQDILKGASGIIRAGVIAWPLRGFGQPEGQSE
jgi:hypothetical protein